MKMFRRIFALTMVIAMVCLFSASAFAKTSDFVWEDYDDNTFYVEAAASITQTNTSGYISLTSTEDVYGNYVSANVIYRYYQFEDGGDVLRRVTGRNGGTDMTGYVFLTLTASDEAKVVLMSDATYQFYAEVPTSYGMQMFTPNDMYLVYEIGN